MNCDHDFYAIQRHPTSDVICYKCNTRLTYVQYIQYKSLEENAKVDAEVNRLLNFLIKEYIKQGGDHSLDWKPLDTTVGKLTQINNLLTAFNLVLKEECENG